MSIEITEKNDKYILNIRTDTKTALIAYFNGRERIYLPEASGSDSTYYVEKTDSLIKTDNGYRIVTDKKPDRTTLIN